MIKIDFSNTKAETDKFKTKLPIFLEKIKPYHNTFLDKQNKETIEKINSFAKKITNNYKHIVVLGIGGSALGTICLQQSFQHLFQQETKTPYPKLYVIDNIDPTLIKELEEIISLKKTLFIVVSKSGETIETLSQYTYFRSKTDKAKLDPKKHFVFITDPSKGKLRELANTEKIPSFEIPKETGGRFSIFTSASLLPAKLIGIKIENLLKGAQKMQENFFCKSFQKNLPFQLASTQYILERKGKNINILMPYSQKLIKITDWYRQLLAESIGKKKDKKGKIVHTGITPVNALGVTDQHSQLQLYNEGPKDKLIMFIETQNQEKEIKIPTKKQETLSFNKLIKIEKNATEKSLSKNNRPNLTIEIDSIHEESLGELLMLFMGSIAFLGEFYNINAYNQPGVELCKKITKENFNKL